MPLYSLTFLQRKWLYVACPEPEWLTGRLVFPLIICSDSVENVIYIAREFFYIFFTVLSQKSGKKTKHLIEIMIIIRYEHHA